ncbi:MAG: hypothetical protein AB7Q42_00550 [Acidimicrobiia bacterium]
MTLLAPDSIQSTVVVRPWVDPVVDPVGYDPHGRYVELFWLGVLGPTATWLLRRLAFGLEHYPDGYELDLTETATALGLTFAPGKHGPFVRALQRCVLFGMAHEAPSGLAVRRRVPPLAARQIDRLPPHLQSAHAQWGRPAPVAPAERSRAEAIASALLQQGDSAEDVERRLALLGTPPLTATAAIRVALANGYVPLDAA